MEYQYKGHRIVIHSLGSHFYLTINRRTVDQAEKRPRRIVELNGTAGRMPVRVKIFLRTAWWGVPRAVTFIDGVEAPVPEWAGKMYEYNGHKIWVDVGERGGPHLEIDGQIVDRDGGRKFPYKRELNGIVDGAPVHVKIRVRFAYGYGRPTIEIVTFIDGAEAQPIMVADSFSYPLG